MSDNNDTEFERDFSEETEANENLNQDPDVDTNSSDHVDPIAEANESLITMDSAPFDKSLENISQTLASIDSKMDQDSEQLKKLDQLDQLAEIKEQLDRIENTGTMKTDLNESNFDNLNTSEYPAEDTMNDNISEINQENLNTIGHNQQEISELYEKIEELKQKLLTIENQSNQNNEKIQNIENTVERFEELENEIQVEYEDDDEGFFKKLFKKKDKTEPYTKNKKKENHEIKLTEKENSIPKNTESIIEEAEKSMEKNKEILIDGNQYEIVDEDENEKKSKNKNLKYGIGSLAILTTLLVVLFFFDKFEIIDLSFYKVIESIISLF